MIEIMPIGGYNEFGKNMTAVKIDDDVIIFDMGLHVENYINLDQDDCKIGLSKSSLIKRNVIPDDTLISDWKKKVRAIIPSHAHLDHIGAIPYLAKSYSAPIICTPYTGEVIKILAKDEGHKIKNRIISIGTNETYILSPELKIEFINMTHSIPQTVMVALHTKYGIVMYANDFKFDNYPVLGQKPNYKKLEKLKDKGVLSIIMDGTGAKEMQKTPSEKIVKEMFRDLFLHDSKKYRNIIVTTFSSHLARIKTIIEFAKKIGREPVLLGRSMSKYSKAGQNIALVDFEKDAQIIKYKSNVNRFLKKISKQKSQKKYLILCTGHQGEQEAILGRIAYGEIRYDLDERDCVIFSSRVIPSKTNEDQWGELQRQLKTLRVHIYNDVHVSGHASREDHRDLIDMVHPKHIIPAHGSREMVAGLKELALEMGYDKKHVHLLSNGSLLKILD